MPDGGEHQPVLLEEVLDGLRIRPDGVYVDGTFGRGGHSAGILARLGDAGRLLALDRDPEAVSVARRRFASDPRFQVRHANFAALAEEARAGGWAGAVDGLLLDLGMSSPQLDQPERGFGFLRDGPLDMRMDPSRGESAAQWLARAEEREIAAVLWELGEERRSRRIARALVARRAQAPLRRTAELAALIAAQLPRPKPGDKHPATRSFQAIRMHVNDELGALAQALDAVPGLLAPGGRLAVISFHSLEDRMVKRFIRRCEQGPARPRGLPPPSGWRPSLRACGGAVRPGPAETARNPRARSAVLRVAERLP